MNKHDNLTAKPTQTTVSISPKHSPIMKRWRDLTGREKMRSATQVAMNHGGYTANINLAPDLAASLTSHPDPIRFLYKRMNKELSLAGMKGLPVLLALELTRTSVLRLHLHGIFVPGQFPVSAVQQVFRKAELLPENRTVTEDTM